MKPTATPIESLPQQDPKLLALKTAIREHFRLSAQAREAMPSEGSRMHFQGALEAHCDKIADACYLLEVQPTPAETQAMRLPTKDFRPYNLGVIMRNLKQLVTRIKSGKESLHKSCSPKQRNQLREIQRILQNELVMMRYWTRQPA